MKTFYGNYLGVVITGGEKDPEGRGRTQIFVPNIMPALYENWNEPGEDIEFEVIGQGLEGSLSEPILTRLRQILPWAECASPIIGASPSYKPNIFNKVSETLRNVCRVVTDTAKDLIGIDEVPQGDAATNLALSNVIANDKTAALSCGRTAREVTMTKLFGYTDAEVRAANSGQRQDGKNWDTILENLGWQKVAVNSPSQAPTNSMLVYKSDPDLGKSARNGGGGTYGHIEYKGVDSKGNPGYYYGRGMKSNPGGSVPDNFTGYAYIPPPDRQAKALQNAGLPTVSPSALPHPSPVTSMPSDPTQETALNVDLNQQIATGQDFSSLGASASTPTPQSFGSIDGVSTGKTAGGLPVINPNDVKVTGPSQTRSASVYGSVFSDFTTYLDVKPEQRPPEATTYWQNKGYNIQKQESQLSSRLSNWKPSLNLADTGKGAYISGQGQSNLTPGFSVAVPSNNAYGLKPGSFIQVKNSKGEPIGPNNGYFQVADKGNSQNLTKLNALDFYSGNDPELKKYFEGLQGKDLNVEPVEITGESAAALKESLAQQGNAALEGTTMTDTSGLASATSNQPSTHTPTPHQGISGPNTNNQALGMFGYASEGQAVWVFFREGDPLSPVYFAASYGQKEWGNMYQYNSPLGVGAGDGGALPGTEAMALNTYGGGLRSAVSTEESPLGANFSFQLYDKNGSNLSFLTDHTEFNSMYNHVNRVLGDHHDINEANKEVRVRGDFNKYVEQDFIITVGNWSDKALAASDEIQQYINEAMEIKSKTT